MQNDAVIFISGSSSSGSDSDEEGGHQEEEAQRDQENEEINEEEEEEGGEEVDAPSASSDAHPASDTEDNIPLPDNLPADLTQVGGVLMNFLSHAYKRWNCVSDGC